jgi:hypothetical protein
MYEDSSIINHPAPCIIDRGIIVNKLDILKLLGDLNHVSYIHLISNQVQSQGEGIIYEVLSDSNHTTMIANHSIYLNIDSFDYLELGQSDENQAYFDLVQSDRILRLIPLSNPLENPINQVLIDNDIEAIFDELDDVMTAKWDTQNDEDDFY